MTLDTHPSLGARIASRVLRTRFIVRAPIYAYKLRLGWLFGDRLIMIEHVGRKSGKPRYVVVEVVDRPASGGCVVVSGFGERAQWYRNILANPHVRLFVGGNRPVGALAKPLPLEQAAAALHHYAEKYPKAWARLRPVFEETLGSPINEDGTNLPMLLIKPKGGTHG